MHIVVSFSDICRSGGSGVAVYRRGADAATRGAPGGELPEQNLVAVPQQAAKAGLEVRHAAVRLRPERLCALICRNVTAARRHQKPIPSLPTPEQNDHRMLGNVNTHPLRDTTSKPSDQQT